MNDIINLNNNYYIKVVNKNNEIPFESMNIKNLKYFKWTLMNLVQKNIKKY